MDLNGIQLGKLLTVDQKRALKCRIGQRKDMLLQHHVREVFVSGLVEAPELREEVADLKKKNAALTKELKALKPKPKPKGTEASA